METTAEEKAESQLRQIAVNLWQNGMSLEQVAQPTGLEAGLTQKEPKVGVIHELPLRKNKVFSHILRKS